MPDNPADYATFAHLARHSWSIHYSCRNPRCGHGIHFRGEEGVKRFGAETTIEQVRRRLVCSRCGGKRIIFDLTTPGPVKNKDGWLVMPRGDE